MNNEQQFSMNPFVMLGYIFRSITKLVIHTDRYFDVYGKGAELANEYVDDQIETIRKSRAERRASITVIEAQPSETKKLS